MVEKVAEQTAEWTRVTVVERMPVVLTVDFDGTGRVDATFRDLVRFFPKSAAVWAAASPRGATGAEEHLRWWSRSPSGKRPVRAVLGYCAGSSLAVALADRLVEQQAERPAVVLFDPEVPTVAALVEDLGRAVNGMTTLSEAERRDCRAEADRMLADRAGDEVAAFADGVLELYDRAASKAFGRLGLDADQMAGFTGLFHDYLAYLVASVEQARTTTFVGTPVVLSRDTPAPDGAEAVRIDVARRDLLRSPLAAAEALRVLTR